MGRIFGEQNLQEEAVLMTGSSFTDADLYSLCLSGRSLMGLKAGPSSGSVQSWDGRVLRKGPGEQNPSIVN